MKCDKLKPIQQGSVELGEYWVYDAEEVDAAIAELKAENKKLKASSEQIMNELFDKVLIYPHEMVSLEYAYKLAVSLKNTKRALWLARAERNKDLRMLGNFRKYVESRVEKVYSIYSYPTKGFPANYLHKAMMDAFETWCKYFKIAEDKCRAKAEEYK